MFRFNGKNLEDFGLRLLSELEFNSPSEDIDFIEIPGRDGVLSIPNNRLNTLERVFPFGIKAKRGKTLETTSEELANFLRKDNKWHDLEWSGDKEHVYKALHHTEYQTIRKMSKFGSVDLVFTMHPVKYIKTSLTKIPLSSSINNPTIRKAKPTLIISGSGDITVTIGTSKLTLRGVDRGVIVDSEAMTVTTLDGTRSQLDKMTSYPFPSIRVGTSNVIKTGNITSIEIIPKFEVVI